MGGCMSDAYGPDVRAARTAHRSGVHGKLPPRRKTSAAAFRFNQTLKRAVPRRNGSAVGRMAVPSGSTAASTSTALGARVPGMFDDDIDAVLGGRETNFYERGSFTGAGGRSTIGSSSSSGNGGGAKQQQRMRGPLESASSAQSSLMASPPTSPRRTPPVPPPRRRTTDLDPVAAAAAAAEQHARRKQRRSRARDEGDRNEERPRRSGGRQNSEREADPVLRKLTGQARYNSDGPMGKSWDRVQAVIQRRSQERGSNGERRTRGDG